MEYSYIDAWIREQKEEDLQFEAIKKYSDQYCICFRGTSKILQINLTCQDSFCFFTKKQLLPFEPVFGSVCELFQKSVLKRVSILGNDRIIALKFGRIDIYNQKTDLEIIIELIPGRQNIIFTKNNYIVTSKKIVLFAQDSSRQILPKLVYDLPINKNRLTLSKVSYPIKKNNSLFYTMNDFLEYSYQQIYQSRVKEQNIRQANDIKKKIERKNDSIKKMEKTLLDYKKQIFWKKSADLLKANYSKIRVGMESIMVTDYFQKELPKIRIKLFPEKYPRQNMEYYYKKYRKSKLGISKLKKFLDTLKKDVKKLEKTLNGAKYDYLLAEKERASTKEKTKKLKKLVVDENFEIIIGRNSVENNYITCLLAQKWDTWLHTRAIHGSHIIIRNPNRKSIPTSLLFLAGSLAAYYSKGRNATKIAVDYTQIRYVNKIRTAPMGKVTYKNQKSIFVTPKSMREVSKLL